MHMQVQARTMLACSNAECSHRFCEVSLSSCVVVLPHTCARMFARALSLEDYFLSGDFFDFVSDKTLLFHIPLPVHAHYSAVSSRIFLKM